MKVGYVHPYHSEGSPLTLSAKYLMKNVFQAVGPEQVSPHYESLSRSRRGLIWFFLYIASINTVSRMGGWNHNEWLRGMIWHHEYLIAYYVGFIEIRHFTYMFGPKFTVFYDVYSNYEYKQLCNQWADTVEARQTKHLRHTKEQLEFKRIDAEYEFVKKRSLINYLTNAKLDSEANFHKRSLAMLNSIKNFEQQNLKAQMRDIALGSLENVLSKVENSETAAEIKRASFEAALEGIRSGQMTYEKDLILPLFEAEMKERLEKFKGLSAEEESELLQLSEEQKKIVVENDRKMKNEYLGQAPNINHGTIKMNDKYKQYMSMVQSAAH